jgi:WD repeat and SOF domain-containing protein 1
MGAAVLFIVLRRVAGGDSNWTPPNPFQDPSTLVLTKDEVARIWEWEIMSGHHPSIKSGKWFSSAFYPAQQHADVPFLVPDGVPLPPTLYNPAVPASMLQTPAEPEPAVGYQQKPSQPMTRTNLIGTGPERYYLPIENKGLPPWQRQNHQQQSQHGIDDGAAYAPRPLPGSIVDLDKILEKCDFSTNKVSQDPAFMCIDILILLSTYETAWNT